MNDSLNEQKTSVNDSGLETAAEAENLAEESRPAEPAANRGEEADAAFAEPAEEKPAEPVPEVDWEAEAARWKAQAEETHNRLLRALADMENMRRRMRREQEEMAKYASLKVIEELLPALDNFERALAADKETLTVDSLLEGVSMVYRQIVQTCEREGLVPIEAAGQPFDPNLHEAVMQVNDPNYASGIVVEELRKGYRFKDRVIRPAMVKVNA